MMFNGLPDQKTVERIRRMYPEGCRVELVYMNDPHTTLKPGDTGTVSMTDAIGTIFVDWDSGSSLGIAYGSDHIRKI